MPSTRIWLTNAAAKKIEKRDCRHERGKQEDALQGYRVETEGGGDRYINAYADPVDPAQCFPSVSSRYISKITYVGRIDAGFRTDGLYELAGATLRVETKLKVHGGFMNEGEAKEEKWQEISISARNLKALRAIYSAVRTGTLKPKEDWGKEQYLLDSADDGSATTH